MRKKIILIIWNIVDNFVTEIEIGTITISSGLSEQCKFQLIFCYPVCTPLSIDVLYYFMICRRAICRIKMIGKMPKLDRVFSWGNLMMTRHFRRNFVDGKYLFFLSLPWLFSRIDHLLKDWCGCYEWKNDRTIKILAKAFAAGLFVTSCATKRLKISYYLCTKITNYEI